MALVNANLNGKPVVRGTLLASQTTNTNGTWQPLSNVRPLAITVSGDFAGTVELYATSAHTPPADSDNNQFLLANFTAPGNYASEIGYRWIKARTTGMSGGTANVDVTAG